MDKLYNYDTLSFKLAIVLQLCFHVFNLALFDQSHDTIMKSS